MPSALASAATALALLALAAGPASAQSKLSTNPSSGHPDLSISVSGSGFGASEAVDVYLDTADTVLLVTNGSGGLSGTLRIPASAGPGAHTVTAVGRRSGDAAQVAFTVTTPWLQQGYGAGRLAYNPYENTLTPGTAGRLGVLWARQLKSIGGAPIVSNGVVYHNTSAGVQALSAATGAVLWSTDRNEEFYGAPALDGGVLYAASRFGSVFAMNSKTGALLWKRKIGVTFYGSPTLVDGVIYLPSFENNIYAIRASDGRVLWTQAVGGTDTTAAAANGVVYVGSNNGNVYALDAVTGAQVWSYATGGGIGGSPAVANNLVFVGSNNGKVFALRADTGRFAWSTTTGGGIYAGAAVANGLVYVASQDNYLYALTVQSGAVRWAANLGPLVRPAAVAGGVVYATEENSGLYALDAASGAVLATFNTAGTYLGQPTISDGVVYLDTTQGRTYALALNAGTNALPARNTAPDPAALVPDRTLAETPPAPEAP